MCVRDFLGVLVVDAAAVVVVVLPSLPRMLASGLIEEAVHRNPMLESRYERIMKILEALRPVWLCAWCSSF